MKNTQPLNGLLKLLISKPHPASLDKTSNIQNFEFLGLRFGMDAAEAIAPGLRVRDGVPRFSNFWFDDLGPVSAARRIGRFAMYTVGHSRILGTGTFTPPNTVYSREIMEAIDSKNRFNIDPDWLERTTGIKTRRTCDPNTSPSDMATHAAREALDHAECLPDQIDAIIYAGVMRDRVEPSTAHCVQRKLGARNAGLLMDIANACLGFMSAIHTMDSFIATGQVRYGLIITGEQGFYYTKLNIEHLRKTHDRERFHQLAAGLTLGDAGGAMLLGPKIDPNCGIMGIGTASAGEYEDLCTIASEQSPILADMPPLFAHTEKLVRDVYYMTQQRLGWSAEEIDLYIPHQVGVRANKAHARTCGIDLGRIPNTVSTMGNIASATIPYALAKIREKRESRYGQKLYLSGTGSGISVAQAGVIWDAAC